MAHHDHHHHGHSHHHHHHAGHTHPPAVVSLSILRLSAAERLMAVSVLIAALWAAVYWVMR
jgi:hypothetical protein